MKYSVRIRMNTEVEVEAPSQEQAIQRVENRLRAALQQSGPYRPINQFGWIRAREVREVVRDND